MKIKRIIAILLAAVMLLAFTACKNNGADIPKAGELYAGLNDIFEDGNIKAYYLKNPESFIRAAKSEYGLSEADAQAFIENSENWMFYTLNINISNKTKNTFTFISFSGSETPDGLWMSTAPVNGELSMPSDTAQAYPASILVNRDKVNVNQMYSAIANLEIEIFYCETPEDDDIEITEADCDKLKVNNKIIAPEDDKVKVESQISAKRTGIEETAGFLEAFKSNSVAFKNESELYGMDSETAAEAIADNSGWACYTLNIEVVNKTNDDLTIYTVTAENNGASGVWVCSVSQYGEFGMPGNDTQILPVTVLVDTAELGGKTVEEAIAAMNLSLEYVAGEVIDDFGNESILPTKTVAVE